MKRYTIILFLSFFIVHTHAQNETLRFEQIGIEEGLSNNNVKNILQDSKGYLWFGTMDGLNKYDGYSFTKYRLDPLDSNSLPQNSIYTLWEDKYGSIWVGTFEGLCRFDRSTEKFTRYKPSTNAKFSDPNISAVNEDSDGMMWAGNFSGQLCRFDRQKGIFLSEKVGLGGINCIYKDRSGTLWVGTTTGLHRLNLQTRKAGKLSEVIFTNYQYDTGNLNSLSSNTVVSIFEDRNGIMWIGTDNGLNSFDKKKGIFKRYQHDPKNIHSISSNNVAVWPESIKEDQQGNLWIGTEKGLNKLNPDRTIFTSYFHNPRDVYSLSTDIVISVHIDKAGILYAGCWRGKLNKANLNPKPFGLSRNDSNNINSLSSNMVTSIIEDSSGIVWIGTYGGGLNRWDRETNQFKHFRHNSSKPRTLRYDEINAILEDHVGHLWVCNGNVLSQLNKQTGEFTHYYTYKANDGEEKRRVILSITEDPDGLLWLGTGNGIKSFDQKTGKFEHYYFNRTDTNGVSDATAKTIYADSRDNIWVGNGSIATDKFNKRSGRFINYKHDSRDSNSISSNVVNSFFEDSKGNLWLGTLSGGLCYFDYKKQKFTTFTDKQGLPGNTVYSILSDSKNHLWLGTSNGLSQFDLFTKTFTNYDYTDGLQSNIFAAGGGGDMDRGPCFKSEDGTLYFGGPNGFNFFNPDQIEADSTLAPVVITRFKLFDKLVKGANETKEIVLKYNENYFSFEFSSLSYASPEQNQYAYKLEGVDKDWVYSGSRHYTSYTNIDPGTYTFKVKGTNSDGIWNEEGTSISIIIKPPWWRTWWAYCIYGLCFIAGIFMVDRYRRKRAIIKERDRTRERELQQAHEIEKAYHKLKDTQAQLIHSEKMASLGELTAGIAHEIQNPLNFVNNFSEVNNELIEEMSNESDINQIKAIANDIRQNNEKINHHGKRADAIVKNMLQHSRAGTGKKELTDINALANEHLRLSYHAFRAKDKSFDAIPIAIGMQTDFDESIGQIDIIPQDIGRVLLNLYNNAFYAVDEKRKQQVEEYEPTITVTTKKIDDKVQLTIKDNGNGIPQKVVDKIFQPFFTTKPTGIGTGLGLSLSYDIIKAHGGELKVLSKENEGAEFIINFITETKF